MIRREKVRKREEERGTKRYGSTFNFEKSEQSKVQRPKRISRPSESYSQLSPPQ